MPTSPSAWPACMPRGSSARRRMPTDRRTSPDCSVRRARSFSSLSKYRLPARFGRGQDRSVIAYWRRRRRRFLELPRSGPSRAAGDPPAIHRQMHEQYDRCGWQSACRWPPQRPFPRNWPTASRKPGGRRGRGADLQRVVDPDLIEDRPAGRRHRIRRFNRQPIKTTCQQMMDRSAHEIQSRRDRFRYPARD